MLSCPAVASLPDLITVRILIMDLQALKTPCRSLLLRVCTFSIFIAQYSLCQNLEAIMHHLCLLQQRNVSSAKKLTKSLLIVHKKALASHWGPSSPVQGGMVLFDKDYVLSFSFASSRPHFVQSYGMLELRWTMYCAPNNIYYVSVYPMPGIFSHVLKFDFRSLPVRLLCFSSPFQRWAQTKKVTCLRSHS